MKGARFLPLKSPLSSRSSESAGRGLRRCPFAKILRFSYGKLMMLDRITIDPSVCEGKPTIRGMRITVDFVLKLLGEGHTADDIVREYPELEREDVYQAAKYGAWLVSEKTPAKAPPSLTTRQQAFLRLCGSLQLGMTRESLRTAELDRLDWESGQK